MKRRYLYFILYTSFFSMALLLSSCEDTDALMAGGHAVASGDIIHIGGISTDGLVASASVTRAGESVDEENIVRTDAENIEWLRRPLFDGLDITYGKASDRSKSRVAVLKLLQDPDGSGNIKYSVDDNNRYAEYSFMFRNDISGEITTDPAIWHDNGAHFFEGLYMPDRIKYDGDTKTVNDVSGEGGSAANLATNQHDDATTDPLGNYTLLSHYLGMPSNFTLNATVARVKLPFRHRLARVLAYILIDPVMGNVTLDGYSYTPKDGDTPAVPDDPSTTAIKFCNVNVLAGVKDSYDSSTNHHTYTPQWTEARKATPHFVDERGSYDDSKNKSYDDEHFIAYYDTEKNTYIYPTDAEWSTINGHENEFVDDKYSHYERTDYGTVPVYDLIVRPTYTSLANVMYDEDTSTESKQDLYAKTNQIDFELTLSNGLHYTKRFVFDLDANYQTVVYLHISRERVDYNSSGNDIWRETLGYDDYYGVNNENGNNLSMAGSSWQRAYSNKDQNYNVTDGHQYQYDTEDEYAQYVTDAKWIEMLREAYISSDGTKKGKHHGDYFILDRDISIPAAAFPEDFIFTGHLDGRDHTITITDGDYTKVTHPVRYVPYEQNAQGTETKYFNLHDIFSQSPEQYEEVVSYGDPFYEKVMVGDTEEYQRIADIYVYEGTYAYALIFASEDEEPDVTDEYGNKLKYIKVVFYKRDYSQEVTETFEAKTKPYHIFAGLNGHYGTEQEISMSRDWEANVHKEGSKWVPYTNGTDGWRAEIMNTNFVIDTTSGCSVFKPGTTMGTHITGYLHNCWVNSTYSGTPPKWSGEHIENYTPSLPEY